MKKLMILVGGVMLAGSAMAASDFTTFSTNVTALGTTGASAVYESSGYVFPVLVAMVLIGIAIAVIRKFTKGR